MDTYEATIPLGDVLVSAVDVVLTTCRERGSAELNFNDDRLPVSVTVRWEVDGEGIEDLWDLRDVVNELEAELSGIFANGLTVGKPTKVR